LFPFTLLDCFTVQGYSALPARAHFYACVRFRQNVRSAQRLKAFSGVFRSVLVHYLQIVRIDKRLFSACCGFAWVALGGLPHHTHGAPADTAHLAWKWFDMRPGAVTSPIREGSVTASAEVYERKGITIVHKVDRALPTNGTARNPYYHPRTLNFFGQRSTDASPEIQKVGPSHRLIISCSHSLLQHIYLSVSKPPTISVSTLSLVSPSFS